MIVQTQSWQKVTRFYRDIAEKNSFFRPMMELAEQIAASLVRRLWRQRPHDPLVCEIGQSKQRLVIDASVLNHFAEHQQHDGRLVRGRGPAFRPLFGSARNNLQREGPTAIGSPVAIFVPSQPTRGTKGDR
jgi:hypothetical protein